jgi:hypothetical protein
MNCESDMNCLRMALARATRTLPWLAALAASLLVPAAQAQIAFSDVSAAAGIDRRGESYGASWGDLDGDGYLDIFASNHRQQPSLFLNRRNGTFFETAPQTLVWRNRSRADTHGASWADFDNDGDQDLVVSTGTGNLSQVLVNEYGRLVDRAVALGLNTSNVGGRLPMWLDYDGDGISDMVMTQYGGIARVYRQGSNGIFTETTSDSKVVCKRFHYGHLYDVTNDGRLDFLCPAQAVFPQKIYDTQPWPWKKLFDSASPNRLFPTVSQVVDSIVADFNNDGRMDMFLLSNHQLRPSTVLQSSPTHFESQLVGGIKGFKFVTSGKVTVTADWNKADENTLTDLKKIRIGAGAKNPPAIPFTLDPSDPSVRGMPPAPQVESDLPAMLIGFDAATQRWTMYIQTKLTSTGKSIFSEAYLEIDSTSTISNLVSTGIWPSDKMGRPTLLTNYSGGFVDETALAGLDTPVSCGSVTAGDFDNDMDVDLYLACRTGASNIANILYENMGNGRFRAVANAGGAAGPVGIAVASGAGTADSVISGDYNVDGFLDLFVTNGLNLRPLQFGGPNSLFRNKGNGNNWIQLDLVGTRSDRDAVGARVYATANGVTQLRVQDGAYHRWSQDAKRTHFGLAGASSVNLTIEWPSGTRQSISNVAANKLYRVTEGSGIAPVRLGDAPVYQCGPPKLNTAVDVGVFIWRDCPSGEWRLKTTAGGGAVTYTARIASSANYVSVRPIGLNADDVLDSTSNPRQISFTFKTKGTSTDGVNFIPKDGSSTCMKVDVPSSVKVYYGPFRTVVSQPFNLDSQVPCTI